MSRAMPKAHTFEVNVAWTGNTGEGTIDYASYERSHEISAEGKPAVPGSSDPVFRGDKSRYNPEERLVASLSTCHSRCYLHRCADAYLVVIAYANKAAGTVKLKEAGGGGLS